MNWKIQRGTDSFDIGLRGGTKKDIDIGQRTSHWKNGKTNA